MRTRNIDILGHSMFHATRWWLRKWARWNAHIRGHGFWVGKTVVGKSLRQKAQMGGRDSSGFFLPLCLYASSHMDFDADGQYLMFKKAYTCQSTRPRFRAH